MGGLEHKVRQQVRGDQCDQKLDREQRHDGHAHAEKVAFAKGNQIWLLSFRFIDCTTLC